MIFPGASNTIIAPEQLDTLGFDPMRAVGTGARLRRVRRVRRLGVHRPGDARVLPVPVRGVVRAVPRLQARHRRDHGSARADRSGRGVRRRRGDDPGPGAHRHRCAALRPAHGGDPDRPEHDPGLRVRARSISAEGALGRETYRCRSSSASTRTPAISPSTSGTTLNSRTGPTWVRRRLDNISVIVPIVDAGELIRRARTLARLSQRGLAARAGVPQPAVSRIERGHVSPRLDTVDQLLRACGVALELVPRPGRDVDRTLIVERLR